MTWTWQRIYLNVVNVEQVHCGVWRGRGARLKKFSQASATPRCLGRGHKRKYLQNDEVIQSAPPPPLVIETQDNGFQVTSLAKIETKPVETGYQNDTTSGNAPTHLLIQILSASAATIPRSCSTRNGIRHSSKFTHELTKT